jgi:hypothetical protein
MAKRNYEVIETATGRLIEADDDDVLQPGQTLRVPMIFRDSMSEIQKSVADAKMARSVAQRFGLNDALDLHKPGQRFSVDAAARAHVEEVYQDEKRKLQEAWRQPTADVSGEFRGQQSGDVCTVREGGVDEGSPGHLRMVNGELRCVQDARPTYDAANGQRIKDAAYREMVDELQNAWRTPAPKSIEPRAKATDAPRTMSLADAQAIRDAAYRQYCYELVNAWKER